MSSSGHHRSFRTLVRSLRSSSKVMKLQMHLLFSNPVLLLLLVLVSPATHAQEVVLSCDKEMHWGYISERSLLATGGPVVLEGRERTMETVDTTKLDIVTKPDANGD